MDYTSYARNQKLEEEMQTIGIQRHQNLVINSQQKQQESNTDYGLHLIRESMGTVSGFITNFINDSFSGKRGRITQSAKFLAHLDPTIIAFIAMKSITDSLTLGQTLNKASIKIGEAIFDQYRFQIFSNEKIALYKKIMERLQKKSNYRYKKRVLVHTMNKNGITYDDWSSVDKLHIGVKLIDIIIESTGLVKREKRSVGKHGKRETPYYIVATDKTIQWISSKNERNEILTPAFTPTIIPPKDWEHPFRGGYHNRDIKPLCLVKVRSRSFIEELSNRRDEMFNTYKAVNKLQKTAFKVEKRTYQVLDYAWNNSDSIGQLPHRIDLPEPPRPHDIDTNKEALKEWSRKAGKVHRQNAMNKSKVIQISKVLHIADKYQKEEKIYFPKQCDFRGRIYDIPMFFNPSANDVSKSMLIFAEGKAIGSQEGLKWLKIHGCNLFGLDKLKLNDRAKFIDDNEEKICAVGDDPLNYKWWQKADEPWQFLTFCFEYNDFVKSGKSLNFVSHIPVSIDHTNSGVQHFSGMMKDEVGGRATNLIPQELPSDIYQDVADLVITKLKNLNDKLATEWLEFGIDRKTTKRATMVKPYSGTRQSCRDYIEEDIKEKIAKGKSHVWYDKYGEVDLFSPSNYLSKYVYESINETVVKADECMKWLQKVARLVSSENIPVIWRTPNGFPVYMAYYDLESKRIKTKMGDSTIKLTVNKETKRIAKRRVSSAISPNYIHSLDGCMLQDAICLAQDYGIESISTVHDCFSTLCSDAPTMNKAIREAFVNMYSRPVLENFKKQMEELLTKKNAQKIPPIPTYGNLDLEAVKDSEFFCS